MGKPFPEPKKQKLCSAELNTSRGWLEPVRAWHCSNTVAYETNYNSPATTVNQPWLINAAEQANCTCDILSL